MENKQCPFCGKPLDISDPDTLYPSGIYWRVEDGIKHYVRHKERRPDDNSCWQVVCSEVIGGCGAEIHADSKHEALAKWNRRFAN